MSRSVFWVSVAGTEISSTLAPILKSLTITDSDGGENDTLEIILDDSGGGIEFPPTNAPIEAGIQFEDEAGVSGPPVQFSGKVDKVGTTFSRGDGLLMTISAKSADVKGKPKEHQEQHHDKGKLSAAAKKFSQSAGLQVSVADGIDIEREYWAMQGESFLNWGKRIAAEVGATFKVRDGKAVFAERSAGQSAGGQQLQSVSAVYGQNIISATLSPQDDRQVWQKFRVRYYDPKQAKYVYENAESEQKGGEVQHLHRYTASDKASAKARGKSNATESDRNQGGGTITINGEPSAQAEAMCEVSGIRPGIDGTYKIKSAKHTLARDSGYTTELELVQPGGSAGTDSRGASGAANT